MSGPCGLERMQDSDQRTLLWVEKLKHLIAF